VEELAVEIDNFDVDLITARSLNVTGVLALRGLQVQGSHSPIWRDDSFTVVHQAETDQSEQPDQPPRVYQSAQDGSVDADSAALSVDEYSSSYGEGLTEEEREDAWGLKSETDALANEASKESSWLSMFQNLEEARRDDAFVAPQTADNNLYATSQWGDVTNERLAELEPEPDPDPELYSSLSPPEAIEDKQDLRVALGGKPLEPAATHQFGVGLLSQLGEKGAKREAELRLQEAAEAEEKALLASNVAQSSGDELEWTRLFLNNGNQAQSFRKVKMCIVQREETLDVIANRYNVQPRELQLYNRLHEPYLSEGQVLYIP
jgi:stage VI sporulation protein D